MSIQGSRRHKKGANSMLFGVIICAIVDCQEAPEVAQKKNSPFPFFSFFFCKESLKFFALRGASDCRTRGRHFEVQLPFPAMVSYFQVGSSVGRWVDGWVG